MSTKSDQHQIMSGLHLEQITWRTTWSFWNIGHVWEFFLTKFFLALKVWWFLRLWAIILHCSNFSVPNLEAVDTSILNRFLISIYQNNGENNLVILAYWPYLRKFFQQKSFLHSKFGDFTHHPPTKTLLQELEVLGVSNLLCEFY